MAELPAAQAEEVIGSLPKRLVLTRVYRIRCFLAAIGQPSSMLTLRSFKDSRQQHPHHPVPLEALGHASITPVRGSLGTRTPRSLFAQCTSEGNWHNALMGYSLLELSNQSSSENREAALQLASSLFSLNGEEKRCLFRYRTHSPYWEHKHDDDKYHQASDQKRAAAQCSCIIMWSKLRGATYAQVFYFTR